MEYSLDDKALCEALSYAFIDSNVDYKYIASIARTFPLDYVEDLFFNYVAPACYYNTVAPVPSVIYYFDPDELHSNIDTIRKKNRTLFGKLKMVLFCRYLKYKFKDEWIEIKKFLNN